MKTLFWNFWKHYPALYFGLSLLIGVSIALTHSLSPLIVLFSYIFFRREFLVAFLLTLCGYLYTAHILPPPLPQNLSLKGTGLFHIRSISPCSSFQKRLLYHGEFIRFTTETNETLSSIPAFFFLTNPTERSRITANHIYQLSGELKVMRPTSFFFKLDKKLGFKKKEKTFSLVEIRYKVKKTIASFLEEKIPHPPSFAFLNGLITGNLDDRLLKFSFSRLGLQHVMAISGSHFAFLIYLLSFVLHRFLTKRKSLFVLLFFVNLYFLFIGPAPSIQRAYLMVQVFLFAQIFSKKSYSLNALGCALFVAIVIDPFIVQDIGFQLSFLCTGALILGTPLFSSLLSTVFKKREEAPTFFHQVVYKTSSLLKEALSLSLAINLWILPLLLYDFHKFPLLSLLYNLFFPLLSFLPLLFLIFSLLAHLFLPFLAPLCYWITTFVTKLTIDLVLYPPAPFEATLFSSQFPMEFLILYWSLLFLGFIYWKEKQKSEKEFFVFL